MIENEENKFEMRINFNLKKISGSKSQIWLTTTIRKERVRIYTGLLIEPRYWIKKSRNEIGEMAMVGNNLNKVQDLENKAINRQIKKIISYCEEYTKLVSNNDLMSNNAMEHNKKNFEIFIQNKIHGIEADRRRDPKTFINDYIERMKNKTNNNTGRRIAKGTIYNHKNALHRLEQFCNNSHHPLQWNIFNSKLEERFTAWMQDENFAPNTIASQYSIMKVWLTEAENEEIITDKSFHKYKTKCYDVDNIYLTIKEINKIYKIDFTNENIRQQIDTLSHIEETRDLFIIACWTGLRYGDWGKLHEACFTDETMTIHTQKTNKLITLPLHPHVKEILEKYEGRLPHPVDKKHVLKQIRKCAEIAGIHDTVAISRVRGGRQETLSKRKCELIMTHTARRSFATNMQLRGVPLRTIMNFTGHTTEENFNKYVKTTQTEHIQILSTAFKALR